MITTRSSLLAGALLVLSGHLPAQLQVTLNPNKDNTIYSNSGSLSNGAGHHLFAGKTGPILIALRRGLIAFDVNSVLPAGTTILTADVTLDMNRTVTAPLNVSLHRLTADWGEAGSRAPGLEGTGGPAQPGDATWTHRFFPSALWSNAGGDFVATASASTTVNPGSNTWSSTPALVADVQNWIDNPSQSFGWILIGNEVVRSAKRFSSRENSNAAVHPQLVLTFKLPVDAKVTSTGTGCAGVSGTPLTLSANGLPILGNGNFSLGVAGGPPASFGLVILAIGLGPPLPLQDPNCFFYLNLLTLLTVTAVPLDGAGAVTSPFPIPPLYLLTGFSIDFQTLAFDPTVAGDFVSSNALTLLLGG